MGDNEEFKVRYDDHITRIVVTESLTGLWNVAARWSSGVGEVLSERIATKAAAEVLAEEFEEAYGLGRAAA